MLPNQILGVSLLGVFLSGFHLAYANTEPSVRTSSNHTWAERLEYVGIAVEEPDYHVWGSSPVIGPEGNTHLFVARWPISEGFGAWLTHCEIARYVSSHPEGPYAFAEVVASGSGQETWDYQSPHNPNVQRVGEQYVLTYIANAGGGKRSRVASQRIGMMIADHPAGPWRKMGQNGLILSPPTDPEVWSYQSTVGVNNPAFFAHPDGRFFLYYKAMRPGDVRRMGVAIADEIGGPYVFHPKSLTSNSTEIEDGYAFYEDGKIYLLTTNNDEGDGYLWDSTDGLNFGEPIVGYDIMQAYISKEEIASAKVLRGKKFERPQVLLQDGHPTHLFVASGANWSGGDGSFSCVFRIKDVEK